MSVRMLKTVEVRIEGELGTAMLHFLGWHHRTVPRQTIVRVKTTAADLHRILQTCSSHGLTIEQVHRIATRPAQLLAEAETRQTASARRAKTQLGATP